MQNQMYNAYCLEEVVSKLPIEALSISNHVGKDTLFIGSKPGHLLSCNHIVQGNNSHYEYIVTKNFEKRPVIELRLIEQMEFIISLTDLNLSIHEATEPYRLIASLTKYKPILNFTYYVEQKSTFILVSLKNRLVFFKIMSNEFEELANISIVDAPMKTLWWTNNLFIAMKNEYQYAKLSINCKDATNIVKVLEHPRTLFTISPRSNENPPLLINISDKSLIGLCRDEKVVDFVENGSGDFAEIKSCRFSDVVFELAYDSPYLIAILNSNFVEIRSISPPMCIQKITMLKVSMLSVGRRGSIYCANEGTAWKLDALTLLQENFKFLKNEKQFELALQLAQSYQPLIDQNQIIDLKKKIAAYYFMEQKFSISFEIHIELNTDILFVINLFSEFVPEKYISLISRFKDEEMQLYNNPQKLPLSDRKYAIQALVEFLSTKRNEHSKPVNLHYMDYRDGRNEHILSVNELKRHEASLELIDSVLLKCYIEISPTLVGSLLRSKNCSCIISEAEKDLKQSKMFEELLILYKQKKMYRKYLEFLQREVKKEDTISTFPAIEKISDFLMELKQDQFPLILEFSSIIFSENINLGIKIFTEGENGKNFDRELVLQFLKRDFPQAVISYLEYIILNWNDMRPKFHEELLSRYVIRVRELMAAYVKSLASNNTILSSDHDELTLLRKKLRKFLQDDKHYTIKDALNLIKTDQNLVEENAVIFGRMGQHLEALNIYINILMDFDAAEHHCQIYYNEKNEKTSHLFYNLFHFYITGLIDPTNKENPGQQNVHHKRQNLTEALKLLRRHPTKINIVSAFGLIPTDTPLQRISEALKIVFESFNNRLTSINLLLSLTNISIKKNETQLNFLKKQRIHINERVECLLCGKKVMDSAFVRRRDFSILHYFCYKTNLERKQQRMDTPLESSRKKQSH